MHISGLAQIGIGLLYLDILYLGNNLLRDALKLGPTISGYPQDPVLTLTSSHSALNPTNTPPGGKV